MTMLSRLFALALAGVLGLSVSSGARAADRDASASNAPVRTQMTEEGLVFTTTAGRTLYMWDREDGTPGKAQCTDEHFTTVKMDPVGILPLPLAAKRKTCVDKWPPLLAAADARPGGPWTLAVRDDGSKQWAYLGHPLYSSIKDKRPGDVNATFTRSFDRDWRPAFAPLDYPGGLKLVQKRQGLVLTTADGRSLFTRMARARGGERAAPQMTPLAAPAIAKGRGDWSIVRSADGEPQYAFRGQPLFLAADGMTDDGVLASGAWTFALARTAAPVPAQIRSTLTLLGEAFTDQRGKLLYTYDCAWGPERLACNDPGDAAAYIAALCGTGDRCAKLWQPLIAAPGARAVGEWTIEDVPSPIFSDPRGVTYTPDLPRVKAWVYRGRPVYIYGEEEPGQMLGDGYKQTNVSGFFVLQVPGNVETGR